MITKEEKQAHLHQMWDETMNHHLCGNYIGIEDECVEWFINYDNEEFVALTEYGSYHHQYDWDFSYDANLETFVGEVIEFVQTNRKENKNETN